MKYFLVFVMVMQLSQQIVFAADKITADILIQSSSSWEGGDVLYPQGDAEITIVKIDIPRNSIIPLHCHPIPLAAYVLKGEVEVTTVSGEVRSFKKGQAFVEVMDKWHKGLGVGEETQLIVFYAGRKGVPLSVKKNDAPVLAGKCKQQP
jgi:quercetin dioxygenase-like cupin family protein